MKKTLMASAPHTYCMMMGLVLILVLRFTQGPDPRSQTSIARNLMVMDILAMLGDMLTP